jgi:hypothetical protein
MEKIEVEYRGFTIEYSEYGECWWSFINEKRFEKETLAAAKKRIDDFLKKEEIFQRFDVYASDGYRGDGLAELATVTSIAENGECWITKARNGERGRVNKRYLFPITPENDDLISEYDKLEKQKRQISERQKEIFDRIERLK